MSQHRFTHGQICNVDNEEHSGQVEVRALLAHNCAEHDAPRYGCSAGDKHFSFCEVLMRSTTPTQRRKMN